MAQCVARWAPICSNAYGGWFAPHPRHSVRLTYRPSATLQLLGSLRISLNKFLWASKWILTLPYPYLKEEPLENVQDASYLGVLFSGNLTWHNHIAKVAAKDNKMLGFVRHHIRTSSKSAKKLTLLVRPTLEYASCTCPLTKGSWEKTWKKSRDELWRKSVLCSKGSCEWHAENLRNKVLQININNGV